MSKNFIFLLFPLILILAACQGQKHSKAIALISKLNDRGEIQGKVDTAWVEYLDGKGNVLKKVETNHSEYGNLTKITFYNSSGKIVSKILDYGGGHISITEMIRDSNSYLIAFKGYELNSKDTFWTYFINRYDKDLNYVFSSMIDSKDSTVMGRYRSRFDQNKNQVEETELDSVNNEISKSIYEYTKTGKLLRNTYYKNGAQISVTQYKYDGQKKIESILTPSSKEKTKIKIQFIYQ